MNYTDTTVAIVPLVLSEPTTQRVEVQWSTQDGTALQARDYQANSGTVVFEPGEVRKEVSIVILPRAVEIDDRAFTVIVEPPTNAYIAQHITEVTISVDLDGDNPQTRLFVISAFDDSELQELLAEIRSDRDEVRASREYIENTEERITSTTTIDFINFEINNDGELLAHFAGYADASKFQINANGELEVNL